MSEDDRPLSTEGWKERSRVVQRKFPGPKGALTPLRVAFTREAYAEVTAHAKESLDREVGGVLAGEFCEDDEGAFVLVKAIVRGLATKQGRGHVTFTQDTWNAIHETMDKEHKELQIVGWYHTHPSFGVELSEMDIFIQRNFFSHPAHVALVVDPLGGDVALAMNGSGGLEYLPRFFVDGREHRGRVPAPRGAAAAQGSPPDMAALETRVTQLTASIQDLRKSLSRFLLFFAAVVGIALALVVGYSIRRVFVATVKPPEQIAFIPLPLKIDGRPTLVGLAVVNWQIPDELLLRQSDLEAPSHVPVPEETPRPSPSPSASPSPDARGSKTP